MTGSLPARCALARDHMVGAGPQRYAMSYTVTVNHLLGDLDAELGAMVDSSRLSVVPWSVGRRLWAATVRDRNAPRAGYSGPPYVVLRDAVPRRILEFVAAGEWRDATGSTVVALPEYGGFDRVSVDLVMATVAGHPWRFPLEREPLSVYLCHRGGGAGSGLAGHCDGELDPYRRWVGFVAYLTDPTRYAGGELVIDATGERLRPDRGTVVLLRGDTKHTVEPVTAGDRVTLNAFVAEPRPWLLPPGETLR